MKTALYLLTFILGLFGCLIGQTSPPSADSLPDHVVRIDMHLSALGVESDGFPSITAVIDFVQDTSLCVKSFYNPAYPGSTYRLTAAEMDAIRVLLRLEDLARLKPAYRVNVSDQPRSTTVIHTTREVYTFDDYGLVGDAPLKALYRIVYRY